MKILLTGGLGYIGSHTATELSAKGYDVAVLDDCSNSSPDTARTLEKLTGRKVPFYRIDACDCDGVTAVLEREKPDVVIHFAGLKSIRGSIAEPDRYFRTNIGAARGVICAMEKCGVRDFIFSSSACVYSSQGESPYSEKSPLAGAHPYAETKIIIEDMLHEDCVGKRDVRAMSLRYFNPVGVHESGLLRENIQGRPENLAPAVVAAVKGKYDLKVFGDDYDTPDGTCIRDFIHICDLAAGHVAALEYMKNVMPKLNEGGSAYEVFNLGSGRGYSVLDFIKTFERVNGVTVPYEMGKRRDGDLAVVYADIKKAETLMGWRPRFGLDDMCASLKVLL